MPIAHIIATYNTYTHFKIPKFRREFLLSKEECDAIISSGTVNQNKPGYWWIRWDTLYYINELGQEIAIQSQGGDTDYKRPNEMEISSEPMGNDSDSEEDEDDEEEDEEDEEEDTEETEEDSEESDADL